MYDAALGRFMTIDPLAEWDFKTSPYVYIGNNPIKYIDHDEQRRSKEKRVKKEIRRQSEKEGRIWLQEVQCVYRESGRKNDVKGGSTFTMQGGDDSRNHWRAEHWFGISSIDGLLAFFKGAKKAPKYKTPTLSIE